MCAGAKKLPEYEKTFPSEVGSGSDWHCPLKKENKN